MLHILKENIRACCLWLHVKMEISNLFPSAFGVGDGESEVSWHWFLTKLKGVIEEVEELVIVSCKALSY